jgi:hypothetical protein
MQDDDRGLKKAVDDLSDEARELRSEMRRRTTALWAAVGVAAVVLSVVLAAAFQVSLENRRRIEVNNRKLCPMISLLVAQPGKSQPTTQHGRDVAREAAELYQQYGCRPVLTS